MAKLIKDKKLAGESYSNESAYSPKEHFSREDNERSEMSNLDYENEMRYGRSGIVAHDGATEAAKPNGRVRLGYRTYDDEHGEYEDGTSADVANANSRSFDEDGNV